MATKPTASHQILIGIIAHLLRAFHRQPRPQALMRYRVTEGALEPNVIARSFPPSSSGDVTIDISPRTTGNEAVPPLLQCQGFESH